MRCKSRRTFVPCIREGKIEMFEVVQIQTEKEFNEWLRGIDKETMRCRKDLKKAMIHLKNF